MSEEPKLVPQTDPLATGSKTSEFKFSAVVASFGAVLAGLGVTLSQLQSAFPESKWISSVMVAVGGLVSVFTALGFIKSRSDTKVAMILADSPPMSAPPPKVVVTTNPQTPLSTTPPGA